MIFVLLLSISGFIDSVYLTWEHYNNVIPPCTVNTFLPILSDCGKVLSSPYSIMFGVPLAVLGLIYYGLLSGFIIASIKSKNKFFGYLIILQVITGASASVYFLYIQLGIIGSLCLYCTISALISFIMMILVYYLLKKERYELHLGIYAVIYQKIIRPVFFLTNPEFIHNRMVFFGRTLAKTPLIKFLGTKFIYKNRSLNQKIAGINFENPVGLAAGFDYNADLTQALYYLGFGFQTVGTVTKYPYIGNPPPRLGRLIESKSLMVNKGFKNIGAEIISQKLKNLKFKVPVGISIGMTHSDTIENAAEAINDIIDALKKFEKLGVRNSFYELNISCPNLIHTKDINFYNPKNLDLVLTFLDKLKLKKPIFIKMPIDKSNKEITKMLEVIVKHESVKGVIFGNLQNNRKDPALKQSEVKKFKTGNFSGKACEQRSNELIKLAYNKYKDRLIIIGCGGIFNAEDAYKKIKLGASLVQLITGMVFQGPQLISQINLGLIDLIKKDGFKNIKDAVGYENS